MKFSKAALSKCLPKKVRENRAACVQLDNTIAVARSGKKPYNAEAGSMSLETLTVYLAAVVQTAFSGAVWLA